MKKADIRLTRRAKKGGLKRKLYKLVKEKGLLLRQCEKRKSCRYFTEKHYDATGNMS